jgi:hypothetical protein
VGARDPTPWSGPCSTSFEIEVREQEPDEGVRRGPGDRPISAKIRIDAALAAR